MPECIYFARHQNCSNGDECLFLHLDPDTKRPLCPHYERGFCPLGPRCALRHVYDPRPICPFYMVGFCPDGQECKRGKHARFPTDLKPPEVRIEKSKEEIEREKAEKEAELMKLDEEDRAFGERTGNPGGMRDGAGRGRGWTGRRRGRNRAKGGRF
jgi:cleavage and polyadenylation specificity factor subunit 4